MVLFECCNIFAFFSQKSSAKVQKIIEIYKCFSNYFGDKSTHAFFTIKAKSWSVLTDSQSVPDGPRVRSRRKISKIGKENLNSPSQTGEGRGGAEDGAREGLREGSKSPLPHYEPSIYGPSSPIEGEREGKMKVN